MARKLLIIVVLALSGCQTAPRVRSEITAELTQGSVQPDARVSIKVIIEGS